MPVHLKYQTKNAVDTAFASRTSVGAALVSLDLHATRQLVCPVIALAMGSVSLERVCARLVGQPVSMVVVVTRRYAWMRAVLGMVCVRRASVTALPAGEDTSVRSPYALESHNAAATAFVRVTAI